MNSKENDSGYSLPPETLFRFRSNISEYFCDDLENAVARHKVWLQPASDQNDPYEAFPAFVESSAEELEVFHKLIRKKYGNNFSITGSDLEALAKRLPIGNEKRKTLKRFNDDHELQLKLLVKSFLGNRNIIKCASFCEIINSLLLWGHYANGHKGICLKYCWKSSISSSFPSPSLHRMIYSNDRPQLSILDAAKYVAGQNLRDVQLCDEILSRLIMDKVLLTKSLEWEYEKEWRWIEVNEKSASYKIVLPMRVESIYCGIHSSKETQSKCLEIAQNRVEVFQAIMSETTFETKFQPLN